MPTLEAATLNKMMLARIHEVAKKKPKDADPHLDQHLQRSLGIYPLPPRTDLAAQSLGKEERDGYSVEKVVYQSRPGLAVPGLLYAPLSGATAAVIFASDCWADGKAAPAAQAFGIAMAHHGVAALVLEAPGKWYDKVDSERSSQGDAWDVALRMGGPALGAYVWDLIRGLDYLAEIHKLTKVGLCGSGIGAEAAMLAFALDARSSCLVSANALGSHEVLEKLPESLAQLAGIAELGDVADWLTARGAAPVLFMACDADALHTPEAVQKTADKTKARFGTATVRFARFLGERDFNRRMREVTAAFLKEQLLGAKSADYATEPIPLTDGFSNPAVAGTVDSVSLSVLGEPAAPGQFGDTVTTLQEIAAKQLAEPYPSVTQALIPWGTYGHIPPQPPNESVKLTDGAPDAASIALPCKELDYDSLTAIGLSGPEFLAQVLHLWLPGLPEGWESVAAKGDPLSAMVASVRTLVNRNDPKIEPLLVEADGAFASLTARYLNQLRPSLTVTASDHQNSWKENAETTGGAAAQPGARYRGYPAES
jgi:hypothetical protein